MLPDYERKVLRILYNYNGQRKRNPSMDEFEVKTGQHKERIKEALMLLEKENYITWEDKSSLESIVILEGWERGSNRPMPISVHGTVDYWTEY